MADDRATRHVPKRRRAGLVALGALALVLPIGLTSAAWVDLAQLRSRQRRGAPSTSRPASLSTSTGRTSGCPAPRTPSTTASRSRSRRSPMCFPSTATSETCSCAMRAASTVGSRNATLEEITTTRDGVPVGRPPARHTAVDRGREHRHRHHHSGELLHGIDGAEPAERCRGHHPLHDDRRLHRAIRLHHPDRHQDLGGLGAAGRMRRGTADEGALIAPTEAAWHDRAARACPSPRSRSRRRRSSIAVLPASTRSSPAPTLVGRAGDDRIRPRPARCFRVEILTTSADPAPWQVILETDQPPVQQRPPVHDLRIPGAALHRRPARLHVRAGRWTTRSAVAT